MIPPVCLNIGSVVVETLCPAVLGERVFKFSKFCDKNDLAQRTQEFFSSIFFFVDVNRLRSGQNLPEIRGFAFIPLCAGLYLCNHLASKQYRAARWIQSALPFAFQAIHLATIAQDFHKGDTVRATTRIVAWTYFNLLENRMSKKVNSAVFQVLRGAGLLLLGQYAYYTIEQKRYISLAITITMTVFQKQILRGCIALMKLSLKWQKELEEEMKEEEKRLKAEAEKRMEAKDAQYRQLLQLCKEKLEAQEKIVSQEPASSPT